MARASKLCGHSYCPNTIPCPDHPKRAWVSSKRSERTTNGWEQQRRAMRVMRMHQGICHVCGRPGSDQVDHVNPLAHGGEDTMDNLRPIHKIPCHAEKTQREAAAGHSPPTR